MDRFEDLRTFVHVVDAGSISGAANRLGVAKSAVSRRLADLESRLGVQLLRRTTRRLNLTDTGRGFYERSVHILTDLAEAESCVTDAHAALHGKIRMAAPLSFGLRHLSPAINEFLAAHPDLTMEIDFNDRQVDLVEEGFDLAVRIARLRDSTLIARRLTPIRSVVCAARAYLERQGTPKRPEDLAKHAVLHYSNTGDARWSYQAPDGTTGSITVPVRIAANNGDFLCDAAIAGLGLILVPTFVVHQAIEARLLIPILTEFTWPTLDAYAVYPPTRHLSQRIRAFIDFLIKRFGHDPYWDKCLVRDGAAGQG